MWLWFYILSWLLEVPLPKQCNFPLWQWCLPTQLSCPSSWTCSYTCMPKGPRGTHVSLSQREGHFVGGNATHSFMRAAHKTPLYVPASPGPGRPSWAQRHQNTQIQEWEQPEPSTSIQQTAGGSNPGWECWDVWVVITHHYRDLPALLRLQTRCSWVKKLVSWWNRSWFLTFIKRRKKSRLYYEYFCQEAKEDYTESMNFCLINIS